MYPEWNFRLAKNKGCHEVMERHTRNRRLPLSDIFGGGLN